MRRKASSEMTWRAFERQRGWHSTYDGPQASKHGNTNNRNIMDKVQAGSCCHMKLHIRLRLPKHYG